jgi:hypothetical protein
VKRALSAKRTLLIGMGGGGDVVGALAVSELVEEAGGEWVLGGVAWERSPIDPRPGPRSLEEIEGGRPCGPAAVLADAGTRSLDGVAFAESRMAGHLGRETLLLDITRGPAAVAEGIGAAAQELGCDAVVMIDVGGDVLAHGSEPGLASPLCDAIMLGAADLLATPPAEPPEEERRRTDMGASERWRGEVLAAVYGPGCDGELTPAEVLQRIEGLERAEALLGTWGLTPSACEKVEAAAEVVPTEASLQAVRCARGERGEVAIRSGIRTVELTPMGALTFFFDPARAVESATPLARAVRETASLEEAHEMLGRLGVRTELELERERARSRE